MKNSSNLCLSISPSHSQFQEIEKWLIEEQHSARNGFYCNWKSIKRDFENKDLLILLSNDLPVGFACLKSNGEFTAEISITEIKASFRNRGIGRFFIKMVLDHLSKKNIYVVELQCASEESESFWKKLEFVDVPVGIRYFINKHLYKTVIPTLQPVENIVGSTFLEIWDDEPHLVRNKPSKWKWEPMIDTKTGKFTLPIIQPCNYNWRIKAVLNGITVQDDKIKRFGNLEIVNGNFAIITKFP